MRTRTIVVLSLATLGVAATLAVLVEVLYAKQHGKPVRCDMIEAIRDSQKQVYLLKSDCEGKKGYSDAAIGAFALADVGDVYACWRWRSIIVGVLFGEITSDCKRVRKS